MNSFKTPSTTSKFVLNCSSNFTSVRVTDPNKAMPSTEHHQLPRWLLQSIPELTKDFILKEKIGEGTFSKVYRARLTKDRRQEFALKCIVPTMKWDRVADELRYLRDLGGDSNVIGVKTCLFAEGFCVIVMPYFRHDRFIEFIKDSVACEIRDYMKNLFIALDKVHRAGIIHRDIKPSNFLYNRKLKQYGLVDFGLAEDEKVLRKQAIGAQALHSQLFARSSQHSASSQQKRSVLKDLTKSSTNLAILNKDMNKNPVLIKKRSYDAMVNNSHDSHPTKRSRVDGTSTIILGQSTSTMNKYNIRNSNQRNSHQSVIPDTPPKIDFEAIKAELKVLKPTSIANPCACYGADQVCNNCLKRFDLAAPRAGTKGFRAPEVLLKHLHQTTALDIWSAGVIMICLLSRRYPFFSTISDDMTALAQMITILGSRRVIKAAKEMNRKLTLSPKKIPALDLKKLCRELQGNNPLEIEDSAYDLLNRLLEPDPKKRLTAAEALKHPFFAHHS